MGYLIANVFPGLGFYWVGPGSFNPTTSRSINTLCFFHFYLLCSVVRPKCGLIKNKAMRIYDLLSYKETSQKEQKEYAQLQHTQNGRIRVQHGGNRGNDLQYRVLVRTVEVTQARVRTVGHLLSPHVVTLLFVFLTS